MKKILIVEDVDLNIELMVQLLEDEYQLVVAKDGSQGVIKATLETPDLILMDISLPIMDGYEATRRVRMLAKLRHIPIIGVSAHAMPGDAERAIEAGCDDYITKPVDHDILFDKLDFYLSDEWARDVEPIDDAEEVELVAVIVPETNTG